MKRKVSIRFVLVAAMVAALLAAHGPAARAQPVASITLLDPCDTERTVDLYPGCNNIALSFPDGTTSQTVVQAVTPAGMVQSMWRHDAAQNRFEGFSPAAPQASDLLTVNFMDAVWLCLAGAPAPAPTAPPPAPTATPVPPPAPTAMPTGPSLTPIDFQKGDGKDRTFHVDTASFEVRWVVECHGLAGDTTPFGFKVIIIRVCLKSHCNPFVKKLSWPSYQRGIQMNTFMVIIRHNNMHCKIIGICPTISIFPGNFFNMTSITVFIVINFFGADYTQLLCRPFMKSFLTLRLNIVSGVIVKNKILSFKAFCEKRIIING